MTLVGDVERGRELHDTILQALEQQLPMPLMAKDVMTTEVVKCEPKMMMRMAADLLWRHGFSGLPVLDGHSHKVVGILSRNEIWDAQSKGDLDTIRVCAYMRTKVHVVHPDTPVAAITALFHQHHIGRVPVVDPTTEELVGIVTRGHLLSH